MQREGFFQRWSRLKSGGEADPATAAAQGVAIEIPANSPDAKRCADPEQAPLPTLQDAARLTAESDYSAFVAQGVDKAVQRLAMKKLFSDPHFKLMDGLDIYMSDYNKADPVPAAMLAALQHTQNFLAQAAAMVQKNADAAVAAEHCEKCLPDQGAHAAAQSPGMAGSVPTSYSEPAGQQSLDTVVGQPADHDGRHSGDQLPLEGSI